MSKNINFILLYFVTYSLIHQGIAATSPLWPEKFKYDFTEEQSILSIFSGRTKGTMYYNYVSKKYRLDRESGKHDRYCSFTMLFQNTPCSHYVVDGIRYLHFPYKNYCCQCCTVAQGCGMLKNDWMVDGIKTKEFSKKNVQYEIWKKKGNQENQMVIESDTGLMVNLNLQSNDKFRFHKETFTTFFDDKVFNLPEKCKHAENCPIYSLCAWIPKS